VVLTDAALLTALICGAIGLAWIGLEALLWLLRWSMRLGGDVWLWGACCIGTVAWMNYIS
jgi:hypothetical protein